MSRSDRTALFAPTHGADEASAVRVDAWPQPMDLQYDPDDVAFARERDPSGKAAHEPGAKLDADKTLAGVLLDFAHALSAVADVGTFGAKRYSRGGWQSVENGQQRYLDACMRHLLAHGKGEAMDAQSGLSHLSHAAWNLLAILELDARGAA